MKPMNFYTQNGWAGSNYDSKLSTKEIAAKVRSYAKRISRSLNFRFVLNGACTLIQCISN